MVANGGDEMRSAERVAGMLNSLRQDDRSVIGVVGMVDSRASTKNALAELDRTGLVAVAPTLSADGIGDVSNRYLQLSPPNRDQAKLVYQYVTQVLDRNRIYNVLTFGSRGRAAADDDLYVQTLADGLEQAFVGGGKEYNETRWSGERLSYLCKDQFVDGVVFFGGRYSEFGPFVEQLYRDCSGRLPILVADDSVNRYLANPNGRQTAPTNLPLVYVSKGALSFCGQLKAADDPERMDFLADVREVLGRCAAGDEPVGERVGLAYDAVRLLVDLVHQTVAHRPNGGAGQRWAPDELSPGQLYTTALQYTVEHPYPGITGDIAFGQDGVVVGKRLTLLCVLDIKHAFADAAHVPYEVYAVEGGAPVVGPRRCEA